MLREILRRLAEGFTQGKAAARAPRPRTGEDAVSASAFGPSPFNVNIGEAAENPDRILRAKGATGTYDLYEEIVDTDPDVAHALEERVKAVMGPDSDVLPYNASEQSELIRDFCLAVLRNLTTWRKGRKALVAGGYETGRGIEELIWGPFTYEREEERDEEGNVVRPAVRIDGFAPLAMKWRNPRYFFHRREDGALLYDKMANPLDARPVDDRKFLIFTFGGRYENRYGYSILGPLYLAYWFKKANLKYGGIFNERHAVPTILALAYKELGFTQEDLEEVCESLQVDSYAVLEIAEKIPHDREGVPVVNPLDFVKFLEVDKGGQSNLYETYHKICKDTVLERLKGTALMTSAGGTGSYGLGRAQIDSTWVPTIEDDVAALEEVISDQLLRWVVEVNFGYGVPWPRWEVNLNQPEDLSETAAYWKGVVEIVGKLDEPEKVPLSARQLREDLGLREPDGEEDVIIVKAGGGGGLFGFPGANPDQGGEPPGGTPEETGSSDNPEDIPEELRMDEPAAPSPAKPTKAQGKKDAARTRANIPEERAQLDRVVRAGREAFTQAFRHLTEGAVAYSKKAPEAAGPFRGTNSPTTSARTTRG